MGVQRNDPCPCGSGRKYKNCCEGSRPRSQWIAIVSVVGFALLAAWALTDALRRSDEPQPASAGRVWSEEHGHWHSAGGEPGGAPPGPAPPGKVWNAAHGHWHDAPLPGEQEADGAPPGEAPPGKVWSAEHGHWHDAPTAAVPAPEPAPEEGVSYVDDPLP